MKPPTATSPRSPEPGSTRRPSSVKTAQVGPSWNFAVSTAPPAVLNLTGPELLRVRDVAEELGRRLNRSVTFTGAEGATALLNNARAALMRFGPPRVPAAELLDWVAGWVKHGGPDLGKPTHFESRDGRF